jgi:large subunit ribosomal protein L4
MAETPDKKKATAAQKSAAASKPASKPATKATARPASKTAVKPAAKAAAKAVSKPSTRASDKPPAKPTSPKPQQRTSRREAPAASLLQAGVFSPSGERSGDLELPRAIFGETPNQAVMHQALLRQLANARQGTAATKTRGMVSGGGAKPYRQKGTGRARHGSEREPSMVGGGTVFGPKPRSFRLEMPRQMRRLALRSALSVKAKEGKVSVVETFQVEEPKTRLMVELLRGVGVEDTALVVMAAPNLAVARSVANLPWAKTVLAGNLSLYDLFTHSHLVIAREALSVLEETFAATGGTRRRSLAGRSEAGPQQAAPEKPARPKSADAAAAVGPAEEQQ